ncbi:hypothetical protein GWN43_00805 [Candidatus Bathyarchaeota archaeon]|nr:hypothetical protein [Candidatus Bathyarchaeota archaeon]
MGDYIVEDMKQTGISNTEGIRFTLSLKQEMAVHLKQTMMENQLAIPYAHDTPEYRDFIAELNVERFQLTKTGKIQFSHPQGTHDDRFWALALAAYAARSQPTGRPEDFIFV